MPHMWTDLKNPKQTKKHHKINPHSAYSQEKDQKGSEDQDD